MNKFRILIWSMVAAAVLGLSACGETKTPEQRMSDAQTAFEAGQYRAALIELKNLLQEDPQSKDARVLLARTSLKVGDAESAEKELERAARLGATPDEIYTLQQQTWLRLGNFQQLVENYDPTKAATADARDEMRLVYARALNGLENTAGARREFQALIDTGGSAAMKAEGYVGLATLARAQGEDEQARGLAQQALQADPQSTSAYITLGQIDVAKARFAEAYDFFVQGLQTEGVDDEERFVLLSGELEAALGKEDINASKDAANRLFALSPEHPITNYLLARVAYVSGDKELAFQKAQKVLSEFPEFLPAQFLQGALTLERQEYPQAEMFLSNVVAAQPGNYEARKLLAEANLRLGNPNGAANILREGIQLGAGADELAQMLGRINLRLNNSEDNVAMLEKSVAANPGDEQSRLALIASYIASGRAADAQKLIDESDGDAITPERKAIVKLIAAMQAEDRDATIAQADTIIATWPDNARTHNMIGMWFYSQGLAVKARTTLENAYAKNPDSAILVDSLSRIDNQEGMSDDAEARFEEFLSRTPDSVDTWMSLTSMYASNGETEKSISTLRRAIEAVPEAYLPPVVLTRLLISQRKVAEAAPIAERLANDHESVAVAQYVYGRVLFEQGQYDLCLEYLKKALQLQPGEPETLAYKARAEARLQRYAQAKQSYEALWEFDPGNLEAAQSIALIEQRRGNTAAASDILRQLRELRPDDSRVDIIDADIKVERGNNKAAYELYQKAYESRPSRDLALKLARVAPSQNEDRNTYIRRWLEATPGDVAARLVLAQNLQQAGQGDQAIEEYEVIVRDRPDDTLVLNNLAWLHYESGAQASRTRAVELAARAFEISPNNAQVADTYGWILFRSGNIERGVEVLALADAQARDQGLSDARDITYHYAAALNESGDRSGARLRLQSILNDKSPFYSREDAQRLLDTLNR